MALPAGVQTVTVTMGPFYDFEGNTQKGTSTFTPSTRLLHTASGSQILTKPITVAWNEVTGVGTVVLPATNNAGTNPSSFLYSVTHNVSSGAASPPSFTVALPYTTDVIDLDLVTAIVDAGTGQTISYPEAITLAAGDTRYVQRFRPNTIYPAGFAVVNQLGQLVTANTTFQSGSSYNSADWTVTGGGSGGSATTDASALTSGTLPSARIADGSIADAKLTSGTSLTPAERTKLSGIATAATANRSDSATDTLLAAKAPLASPAFTGTPTGITKSHVGLGNVDNTADTAKPVSTAQQTALDLKANSAATETVVTHDGTTGGGTRPSGAYRVLWVSPLGATHSRPTNMTSADRWEHDAT